MFATINKQKRPNTSVQFFDPQLIDLSIRKYLKTMYVDTGKIKKAEKVLSDDQLTLTTTIYWNSENDWKEFDTDLIIIDGYKNIFVNYATENNIVVLVQDTKHNLEFILGPNPYNNLQVPESWANVNEFAYWYIKSGMPICFPNNAEVFLSDDATSIALFRKGQFQVELYLIHPGPQVPVHGHPDVEVIKVRLRQEGKTVFFSHTLKNNDMHGSGVKEEGEDKGFPLLAIQHWLTREPTTIASMWKGKTVGPKQEALIKRFNPDAYVRDGYADISKTTLNT